MATSHTRIGSTLIARSVASGFWSDVTSFALEGEVRTVELSKADLELLVRYPRVYGAMRDELQGKTPQEYHNKKPKLEVAAGVRIARFLKANAK